MRYEKKELRNEGLSVSPVFDRIADVYDETRRPLNRETLEGMKTMLAKHGCHSVLEVGVGTGRVSAPLLGSGFEVTGIDLSRRMLMKAQAKGIRDLVLADGSMAPFLDRSFDAVLFAHIFHLLDDPVPAIREGARVSRVGVFALMRKRRGNDESRMVFPFLGEGNAVSMDVEQSEALKRFVEGWRERLKGMAKKYDWKWDLEERRRRWAREGEIMGEIPPDDLKIVSEILVGGSVDERIRRFQKGAFSFMARMPEELRNAIVEGMRSFAAEFPELASRPRQEVYQLAFWDSKTLLSVSVAGRKVR